MFSQQQHKHCWKEVAEVLNSCGIGAIKTPEKWRKTWTDWKCAVRGKAAAIKQRAAGTGGGPPAKPLTEIEERLITLIGWTRVTGFSEIPEAGFNEEEPPTKRLAAEQSEENNGSEDSEVADQILSTHSQAARLQTLLQSQPHHKWSVKADCESRK